MKTNKATQDIPYTEFYLAGDTIFKCQTSWLKSREMLQEKKQDLADENCVNVSLITTAVKIVKLPVTLPDINNLLDGTGITLNNDNG